jgi:hypothetical protein
MTSCWESIAGLMIVGLLASWAQAQQDDETYYREVVPNGVGAKLSRTDYTAINSKISQTICLDKYKRGEWGFYIFEYDALAKEQRFGKTALDAHDINWIMNFENRRRACMELLEHKRLLSWMDMLRNWWRGVH